MVRARTMLVVVGLVAGVSASTRAQGVVPGGWSPRVGYQSLGPVTPAPGFGGGGSMGYGSVPFGVPVSPAPYYAPGFYGPAPQTANMLGPLSTTIRRTTGSRRGR